MRVQISASVAFAKKILLCFFVTYFHRSYKLHTSQRQPSTCTLGWVYYGRSRRGLPAAPVIIIFICFAAQILPCRTVDIIPGAARARPKACQTAAKVKSPVCTYWVARCRCWLVCIFLAVTRNSHGSTVTHNSAVIGQAKNRFLHVG